MSAPILSTGGWEPPVTDGKAKCRPGLGHRGLHGGPHTQHRPPLGVLSWEKSEPVRWEGCPNTRNKSGKVLCSGQHGLQMTGSLGKLGIGTDHSKCEKPSSSRRNNIIKRGIWAAGSVWLEAPWWFGNTHRCWLEALACGN